MKSRLSAVLPVASAVALMLALAACASEGRRGDTAIQNGAIVDDLRAPERRF